MNIRPLDNPHDQEALVSRPEICGIASHASSAEDNCISTFAQSPASRKVLAVSRFRQQPCNAYGQTML